MIKELIQKVIEKGNLTFDESHQVMNSIMSGKVNNSHIAGLLVALKSKSEHANEVAGFAKAMREKSIKINSELENCIDVCGTGGDNSNTFNISTAVSFVVAGAGVKVAKHGNRSISSKSGSSDVLTELGVDINLSNKESEEALNKIGISFLFAPNYHPAMKYVMPVRRELGFKTVFNILGPLTNPASVKRQIIGTYNYKTAELMREASQNLEMEKVCFVCTEDKYDEITLTGKTKVFEYDSIKGNSEYFLTPETFGYPKLELQDLAGSNPKKNAKIILEIFEQNQKDARFYVVSANATLALYSSGYSEDLTECKNAAEESLLSGKAIEKLNELKNFNVGGER
ncbi:MAG: anthranilate phosphoribosyltransferase [Ignavibacteriae bacterium]|nr:anthranilate phosphoribosyltransferase [Ignavibacteriota bacterium]